MIEKISEVTYKLDLLKGSTVHPFFHVSLFRQALAAGTHVSHALPHDTDDITFPTCEYSGEVVLIDEDYQEQVHIEPLRHWETDTSGASPSTLGAIENSLKSWIKR